LPLLKSFVVVDILFRSDSHAYAAPRADAADGSRLCPISLILTEIFTSTQAAAAPRVATAVWT
jgi:hypothetical protein